MITIIIAWIGATGWVLYGWAVGRHNEYKARNGVLVRAMRDFIAKAIEVEEQRNQVLEDRDALSRALRSLMIENKDRGASREVQSRLENL